MNLTHREWEQGHIENVRYVWQMDTDQYKDMSLYQALIERPSLMTPEQINVFGELSISHGGFSPLYQIALSSRFFSSKDR